MNKLYRIRVESIGDTILTFMLVTDKQYNIESKIKYKNKEWVVKSCEEFVVTSDEIQVVEEKKSTWFIPKQDEVYYYVESGFVYDYYNRFDATDKRMLSNQKLFRTKEEAKKELLKQQATIRVKKRIAELNDGWYPNWKEDKYVGTITASVKNQIGYIENEILKSRQLTPLEAWLMNGYDVDTYDRVKATGISDTTMYMLSGNSIPVNVLEAIFEELLLTKYD